MSKNNSNMIDSFMDAQKQAIDSMVENTKNFANGNAMVKETIEKGSEWYNNIMDSQKTFFGNTTKQAENASKSTKENADKMNEYYQNWFSNQMNWAKQVQDMNMNFFQNAMNNATQQNATATWNNAYQNFMNGMNNFMNNGKDFTKQWNNWTPGMPDFSNMTNMFNQYYEMLNNNINEYQKSFQNGTLQDTWKNMLNTNENYIRFYELWAPMWKSIQEKTFNMELYNQWFNPTAYQQMMDKFFGFVPEETRQYMQQYMNMNQEMFKSMSANGVDVYGQMKSYMNNMMPAFNNGNMFNNMLNGYNQFYGMLEQGISPIAKMTTPNQYTKNAAEWADIMNRLMVFHIKNAEMQYMVYTQGLKGMDAIAENIMTKIKNGEEISSMMSLYQEWLKLSDKQFVSLYESDEYSKIMAEVSAMQLRLKKDIDMQMEKMLVNIPVATKSELDELYKTIYDLKKQVRQLEKMMEVEPITTEEENTKAKAAPKKATTK